MARKKTKKSANEIDFYVGSRIKTLRLLKGLSQDELAERVGLTFQQIQKYEKGINRVAVTRLFDIAAALKTDIYYFLDQYISPESPLFRTAKNSTPVLCKDTGQFLCAYLNIRSPRLRKTLLDTVKTIVKEEGKQEFSTGCGDDPDYQDDV